MENLAAQLAMVSHPVPVAAVTVAPANATS
jgi:hypothetical protein